MKYKLLCKSKQHISQDPFAWIAIVMIIEAIVLMAWDNQIEEDIRAGKLDYLR
ncbi:hypothetical protein JT359_20375 [Candidatus Poribacteria bacterium]|nr:hypothetical protein [Candidatus Poribacteria bacterium]